VRLNPAAFRYAPEEFRGDLALALLAVSQDGFELRHTSLQLRRRRDVVGAAVSQNGLALQFAAVTLQSDRAIVRAALRQNRHAFHFVQPALRAEVEADLVAFTSGGGDAAVGRQLRARGPLVGDAGAGRLAPVRMRSGSLPLGAQALAASTAVFTLREAPSIGSNGTSDPSKDSCMVCLEDFKVEEEIRILPCVHRFHRQCIDVWLRRSAQCPICKHAIGGPPPQ